MGESRGFESPIVKASARVEERMTDGTLSLVEVELEPTGAETSFTDSMRERLRQDPTCDDGETIVRDQD